MRRLALLFVLLAGCPKSAPADVLAAARTKAGQLGPALERAEKARLDATDAALTEIVGMDSAPFVHPVIAERARILGERITAANAAKRAATGDAVWAALSSDGAIFASTDNALLAPFTRPLNDVDVLRNALMTGASGMALGRVASAQDLYRIHAAAVRANGAVVGAIVIMVPLARDAAQLAEGAQSTARGASVCVRAGDEIACSSADANLTTRARGAVAGRSTDVAGQGVVVARMAKDPIQVIGFIPKG